MLDVLKCIAEFFLNKYVGFYCGLFILCMPAFYRIKLFFEARKNVKLRSKVMLQLCNAETYWITDDIPGLDVINNSIKPFSFVNVFSKSLFDIELFENDEPSENVGFKECKVIPIISLNHYVNLFNKSIFSGFWSLFLRPVTLLDENYFKIYVFKNENNYKEKMIIIIKFNNNYIYFFKFINSI